MGPRASAVAMLAASAVLWWVSGTEGARPVIAAADAGPGAAAAMASLESTVAAHRDDAGATRALAQRYLEARAPGLALALVEMAPADVRRDVRVQHVYARALIDAGRNDAALGAEGRVVAACRPLAEGREAGAGCDDSLLFSALRRADILRALLAMGVEDAPLHPEEARVAYQNATREARIALE